MSRPLRDSTGRFKTTPKTRSTAPSPTRQPSASSSSLPPPTSVSIRGVEQPRPSPPPSLSPPPERIERMAAPAPTTTKRAKLNMANLSFNGRKSDFRGWMDSISLYIIGNEDQFPDDKAKITFVLSYMDGSNKVKLWAGNQVRSYESTEPDVDSDEENHSSAYFGGWPTWEQFKRDLEREYGDPAAQEQAEEHLLTYKQGSQDARSFFNSLELWFDLAKMLKEEDKLKFAKHAMNLALRSTLTVVGFPTTYGDLRSKMIGLDDEEKRTNPSHNPKAIDARFSEVGPSNRAAPATYRVQGHVPAKSRQNWSEIQRMPKGTRPKPNYACFKCWKAGHGDQWHWRDECPRQRQTPRQGPSHPPANNQRAPNAGQNRAQQQQNQRGNGRRYRRGTGRNNPTRGPSQPIHRQAHAATLEEARAALESLPSELQRGFIVSQAKNMNL